MNRLLLLLLFAVQTAAMRAQDVTVAYNLSRLSSYIRVDSVTPNTFSVLNDTVLSLRKRYHSSDFVLDFLNAKGGYGMASVVLADSLSQCPCRFAILVGPHTEGAAEQTAMFLRNAKKAVLLGVNTPGGLAPDVELDSNEDYLTQWYDSLHQMKVVEKTAEKYIAEKDLKSKYKDSNDVYLNFDDNGYLSDMLVEVSKENGVAYNPDGFFYSMYVLLSEVRAEMIRQAYPNDTAAYHKAHNVPIQQAVHEAMRVIESAEYRKILSGE
jgi:hypothetical protein